MHVENDTIIAISAVLKRKRPFFSAFGVGLLLDYGTIGQMLPLHKFFSSIFPFFFFYLSYGGSQRVIWHTRSLLYRTQQWGYILVVYL